MMHTEILIQSAVRAPREEIVETISLFVLGPGTPLKRGVAEKSGVNRREVIKCKTDGDIRLGYRCVVSDALRDVKNSSLLSLVRSS